MKVLNSFIKTKRSGKMNHLETIIGKTNQLDDLHEVINIKLNEMLGFRVIWCVHTRRYEGPDMISIWKQGASNLTSATYHLHETPDWGDKGQFTITELDIIEDVFHASF